MVNTIMEKMFVYSDGNIKDIEHFLKVYSLAGYIADKESCEKAALIKIIALVHDISCPVCRIKYGSAKGEYQEKESEAILKEFLKDIDLSKEDKDLIIKVVSKHHTLEDLGQEHQIIIEADYLVNAAEMKYDFRQIRKFYKEHVKTETGKRLFETLYKTDHILFEIDRSSYYLKGDDPYIIYEQINKIQDLENVLNSAECFGTSLDRENIDKLRSFINKHYTNKLKMEDIEELNIKLSVCDIVCKG